MPATMEMPMVSRIALQMAKTSTEESSVASQCGESPPCRK
jgi:hypothetical protein